MAKLAAVVDSLDAVPESYRDLYVEADGKYRIDAEGVESLVDTSGLKSALEKERKAAKEAAAALKKYDGVDVEEFARLKEEREAAEAAKLQTEGKWEEMKKRLSDSHAKELEKYTGEVSKRDRVIEQLTVENELTLAIEKAGILPEHRKAVRALLKMEARPTVAWDGDSPKGLMGDVAIAEYVESWAKTDEAAYYLPSSGANGSGAKGGGGGGGAGRKPFKEMSEGDKIAFIEKHGQEEYIKHMLATK
jgi:hypothetical protein